MSDRYSPSADSSRIVCRSPAKLNLFLEVLGERDDGYHELVTIMQRISLHDTLTFERAPRGIQVSCSDPSIPTDERNLVWQAIAALRERSGGDWGCRVTIDKRIPAGAGLGGGSSNAGAALKAVDALCHLGFSQTTLCEIAASLGSDVPFFLDGPTAACRGRGEIVEPIDATRAFHYVLLLPRLHVSTAEVYGQLGASLTACHKDDSVVTSGLTTDDPGQVGAGLFNRLEASAFALHPQLAEWAQAMSRLNCCGAIMSGSGSALFALCHDAPEAEIARKQLEAQGWGMVLHVTSDLE